jgi:hypothetical protein
VCSIPFSLPFILLRDNYSRYRVFFLKELKRIYNLTYLRNYNLLTNNRLEKGRPVVFLVYHKPPSQPGLTYQVTKVFADSVADAPCYGQLPSVHPNGLTV